MTPGRGIYAGEEQKQGMNWFISLTFVLSVKLSFKLQN